MTNRLCAHHTPLTKSSASFRRPREAGLRSSGVTPIFGAPRPATRSKTHETLDFCTSAVAAAAIAVSAIALPAVATEMTVTVGGAPMYPSKNIIQNAVNSKDHKRPNAL